MAKRRSAGLQALAMFLILAQVFYYAEQHILPVTRSWRYKVVMRRWVRMDLLQSPQNGPLLARID